MRPLLLAAMLPACSSWLSAEEAPACAGTADCPDGLDCVGGLCVNVLCRPEVCDGADNDCDGDIDEGVLNACGNCDVHCDVTHFGIDGEPFAAPAPSSGLHQTPGGSLTLTTGTVATDFAWPSNDNEGTVSRIDTILHFEVGRYASVLKQGGAPAVPEWDLGCNRPSRSTVDFDGNAYVANRAHVPAGACVDYPGADKLQGSVTKIGLYQRELCEADLGACQCVDRNANGRIETSADCHGNGVLPSSLCPDGSVPDGIDLDDPTEFLGYDDECLLWTRTIPSSPDAAPDANPRAMAISPYGDIWVGDWQNARFYRLRAGDGAILPPSGDQPCTDGHACGVAIDVRPYGAVVDSQGTLWFHGGSMDGSGSALQSIDTATGEAMAKVPKGIDGAPYGITVDRHDRIWMASVTATEGGAVLRFDPEVHAVDPAAAWQSFGAGLGTELRRGRGITATAEGSIWAAFHQAPGEPAASVIAELDDVTGAARHAVDLAQTPCGAVTSLGIGIGSGGTIWTVNRASSNVCGYDPASDAIAEIPIGRLPYTYSDFTGNIFRSFTNPEGVHTLALGACQDEVDTRPAWLAVSWDADTPDGSRIEVAVRVTDATVVTGDPSATATQPPTTSLDLDGADGDILRIELRFRAGPNGTAPTLHGVSVMHTCVPVRY